MEINFYFPKFGLILIFELFKLSHFTIGIFIMLLIINIAFSKQSHIICFD